VVRMRTCLGMLALMVGMGDVAAAREDPEARQLELQDQIRSRFVADPELRNNAIDARVEDGVATLRGTVDTEPERAKAARLAHVEGVNRVDNQLDVDGQRTNAAAADSAITAKLKGLYLGNPILKHGDIAVTTSNGVVTLTGTVPSEEGRQQAVDIARNARGVSRVDDELRVVGPSGPMAPLERRSPDMRDRRAWPRRALVRIRRARWTSNGTLCRRKGARSRSRYGRWDAR
jgi:osmotically-inducible protein OsmY